MSEKWRKLVRMYQYNTRLVSIPARLLQKIGVNPDIELEGRWRVEEGRLVLEVREKKYW